jgi:hypothetical protein
MDLEEERNELLKEIEELEEKLKTSKRGSFRILSGMMSSITGGKRRGAHEKKSAFQDMR